MKFTIEAEKPDIDGFTKAILAAVGIETDKERVLQQGLSVLLAEVRTVRREMDDWITSEKRVAPVIRRLEKLEDAVRQVLKKADDGRFQWEY